MLKPLAFLFIFIMAMIPMNSADAHSPIEKRFPDVNAVIESAPDQVELFSEDSVVGNISIGLVLLQFRF